MRRRRLVWQLFPSYLLITVVAVTAASTYAFLSLRHFYHEESVSVLTVQARLLAERLEGLASPERAGELQGLVVELRGSTPARITVVDAAGSVLADSGADPGTMESHADRPEIAAALSGEVGVAERASPTLRTDMLYVAAPIVGEGGASGAVRVSLPLSFLEGELGVLALRLLGSAALLSVLAAAVSLAVSRRLARPIEDMKKGADRFARGELNYSLALPPTEELAGLAASLNAMASELDAKVRTLNEKRAEEDAMFEAMVEGVIAIDAAENIVAMNRAAGEMLGVSPAAARGRALREVVRSTDVHRLAAEALRAPEPVEADVAALARGERFLQAHGAALTGPAGETTGAVLVLNDVTRMRRLEKVRRDFVANVSHELRTPVTSIRGYAETLLEGAGGDPEETRRFLSIVAKHAERLESVVDDLLYLSRIEQGTDDETIARGHAALADLLRAAIAARGELAAERGIPVTLRCDEAIGVRVNAELMEHAVANLIDNAIKHSEPGAPVAVEGGREGGEIVVRVRDRGCGIPPEHLPRIFERFYRVDKGRSRELGGTGLGLAIVKHIVQAHGGRVEVESAPGRGSTFSIRVPGA